MAKDWETNVAYYALIELHLLPSQLFSLPDNELAIVYAFVDHYLTKMEKQAKKNK